MDSDKAGCGLSVELFNAIGHQAVEAANARACIALDIKTVSGDREHYYEVDTLSGEIARVRFPQPPMNHSLSSVDGVAGFAKDWSQRRDEFEKQVKPVVWVGDSIHITNSADLLRRDIVTYNMEKTSAFRTLEDLDDEVGMGQAEFIRFLRVQFARSFASSTVREQLISCVRSLKSQRSSTIAQGSGSYEVGMISNSNENIRWPDSFILNVPVFTDPAVSRVRSIEVILDVRPEDAARPFRLAPVSEDMDRAESDARSEAIEFLLAQIGDASNIKVYPGNPNF